MDKVVKFLKRLSPDERVLLENVLIQIKKGNLSGLDVRKLKGIGNLFRVRRGSIRIILKRDKETYMIIFIGRRGKGTYK